MGTVQCSVSRPRMDMQKVEVKKYVQPSKAWRRP